MGTIEEKLARKIREARKAKSWRQSDLATESGVSLRAINELEAGKHIPRKSNLKAVAQVLGLDEAQLFSDPAEVQSQAMDAKTLARELAAELEKTRPTLPPTQLITTDQRRLLDLFENASRDRQLACLYLLAKDPRMLDQLTEIQIEKLNGMERALGLGSKKAR